LWRSVRSGCRGVYRLALAANASRSTSGRRDQRTLFRPHFSRRAPRAGP
jgi:hypothetical protein